MMSNREAVKNEIKRRWEDVLKLITTRAKQNVNRRPSYVCPLCGNGSGESGDGLTFNPQSTSHGLKCFKCNFDKDIIALVMEKYGWNFDLALDNLAGWLNIPIDPLPGKAAENAPGAAKTPPPLPAYSEAEKTAENEAEATPEPPADFSTYLEECRERLEDPAAVAYLNARGISLGTARSFGVGFDPKADTARKGFKCPRIIVPASKSFYVARAIDPNEKKRYLNSCKNVELINTAALTDPLAEGIFIVEGAFDAMAIYEAGGQAVALNSTSNKDTLLAFLKANPPSKNATLLLALDKDESGEKCRNELLPALQDMKINTEIVDISGEFKDAAEHLAAAPADFEKAVAAAMRRAMPRPDNTADYIKARRLADCEAYRQKIPTGFENIDDISGGLRPGLYILAAISSLGKTTLAHQMAENIAARGHHVLFFSMEQSTNELVSKSLRRIVDARYNNSTITTLDIMEGSRDPKIIEAENIYVNTIGGNLSIIEGNFDCTITTITEYVKRYIRKNGVKPLVIVDYLQILQPGLDKLGRRQTTKETVDITTTELKRMSRAQGLPVLAISSVNRMNYTMPVDFEALKESGNIEFTADVIYGLQLHCLKEEIFTTDQTVKKRERVKFCKRAIPRELDMVCLKNRFGISSFTCNLKYYSDRELFVPWKLSLKERLATSRGAAIDADAKPGKPRQEIDASGLLETEAASPWPKLAQPKQETIFGEIATGKMLDTEGNPIYMTVDIVGGQRWPVALYHDGAKLILGEDDYKQIMEYNKAHAAEAAALNKLPF